MTTRPKSASQPSVWSAGTFCQGCTTRLDATPAESMAEPVTMFEP